MQIINRKEFLNDLINPEYLGDSVYVAERYWDIVLYTDNGVDIDNIIVLETEVLSSLEKYLKHIKKGK